MRWIVLTALFLFASSVRAGEPCEPWYRLLYPANRCCPKCPNDYCPKTPPCAAPYRYCAPDDYCRKPAPCAAPYRYRGCDDHCRKPITMPLPPCSPTAR